VNQSNGNVEHDLPAIANWNRNSNIEAILVGIKNAMGESKNRRLNQPHEGTNF
jgi:hypothetical protein